MFRTILAALCCIPAAFAGEITLGTPVRSSEMRTYFPVTDGQDRYIIADVQDYAEQGYLLKTDLATGQTRKLDNPREVRQDDSFGALVTRDRHFFYSQANVVLSCDLRSHRWKVWGKLDSKTRYYFAFAEDAKGIIWCAGYPQTNLISLDRKSGKVTDHGRMDPKEAYVTSLAFDDRGVLYGAIAQTRRGLTAFSPATGEKKQLLPDELRKNGRLHLFRGVDGAVYTTVDGKHARLYNGTLEWVRKTAPRDREIHSTTYLAVRNKQFPAGTEVLLYDTGNRQITLKQPDGSLRHLPLPAHSGGTKLSGKTLTADGKLFLASGHPMHLAYADLNAGKLHDFGPIPYVAGGTFTVMRTAPDGKIYAGQYAGGGLWRYDPALPWLHPGISTPLFGKNDPLELAGSFHSQDWSRCVRLNCPDVVLFGGRGWQSKKFTVKTPGKYFVNLQFLKCSAYGKVALKINDRPLGEVQTHSATVDFTPVLSYPVELPAGEHTFQINCIGKPALAGMVGFEISPVDRAAGFTTPLRYNPRSLGFWINEIGQPRGLAISPDNKRLLLGGLAGYGLSGGKLIDYDIPSGKWQIRNILDPGESVEFLHFLAPDQVAVGTTIRAQGGGKVIARHAAVKLYDPLTGKITAVRQLEGERIIGSVLPWQGMLAAVGNCNKLYLLDPHTLELKKAIQLRPMGNLTVYHTPMVISPRGDLILFASRSIWRMTGPGGEVECIFRSPERIITSGAAYHKGKIYFIRSHELSAIPDRR